MRSTKWLLVLVLSMIPLTQCGGGGGGSGSDNSDGGAGSSGGSGSALAVAKQVSVVDATSSASSSLSKALSSIKRAVSDLPADSDYNTVETFVFVEERSADVFDIVNEILCMMNQTAYESMVNLGDYLAFIDITQCEKESDSVEGVGQASTDDSSGGNSPEYEEWVVNSFRENDSSPHIVATWIHMGGDEFEPPMRIHARAEITEGKNDDNPYGIFKMDFQAFYDGGDEIDTGGGPGPQTKNHEIDTSDDPLMKGYLMTERDDDGNIFLKFFDSAEFEGGGFHEAVTLNREGSSVRAHMIATENFEGHSFEHEFMIAANDTYFYRTDGSNNVCLSRGDVDETVHRYNLYNDENGASPGSLATRNSGFSITFTNDAGEKFHGWMGYFGLWLPEEAGLESGDTVSKETFDVNGPTEGTPYTALVVPGKLKRHTRNTVTLEEIHGVPLHWSQCTPDKGACTNFVVKWDKNSGANGALFKTAQMNEETWIPEDVPTEAVTFTDEWSFNFWAQSLQGSGQVELREPETGNLTTLKNDAVVVFYKEDVVYPGSDDAPTDLVCFQECPDPDDPSSYLAASMWEAGENSYEELAQSVATSALVAGTHYAAYTYNAESGLLMSGTTPIVTEAEGPYGSGIWTGRMVAPAELANLACDWDPQATCPWQIHDEVEVAYSWETGPNEWNRLSLLQDQSTGEVLSLEPPLFLEYTHIDDVKYYLEYNGPGNLYGFPGKCVNMDTGEETDCGDWDEDTPIRWVTAVNADDGSVMTDTTTGTRYYTKAIDKEQRMQAVGESLCTEAGLEFPDYDLPDESLWDEPVIGDEPEVDVPAVIGGVLQ